MYHHPKLVVYLRFFCVMAMGLVYDPSPPDAASFSHLLDLFPSTLNPLSLLPDVSNFRAVQ